MIKVGVIGHGYAAKTFHIPLIQAVDGLELAAISTSKADEVKAHYPKLNVFNSTEELIASNSVDLVVITAPNAFHYSLAKACLENNLHVVIEKPMVTTAAEADALIKIANENNVILSVFHNRRWDGDFLTVKKLIENKTLGDIKFFESHFDRFKPIVQNRWREQSGPASGIWYDLGSHLVDQALCLFGLPESITARCVAMRDKAQTTDYFHVQLHYPQLEVVLHGSCFAAAPNHRFKIEGSLGTYSKYGLDIQESQLKAGLNPPHYLYGVEKNEQYGKLYKGENIETIPTEAGCYQHYYQQLAKAIQENNSKLNPVKPTDIVHVLTILELAEKSSVKRKSISI